MPLQQYDVIANVANPLSLRDTLSFQSYVMLTLLKKRDLFFISSLFIFVWKVVRCLRFDCERVKPERVKV